MAFDSHSHHRRSVRLAGYDYSQAGAYFVTTCAAQKRCVFGRMENGAMRLHPYGKIAAQEWERTAELRLEVTLDEWVVMPNHFHAIIILNPPQPNVGAHGNAPNYAPQIVMPNDTTITPDENAAMQQGHARAHCHAPLRAPRSLSSLVSGFKGSVTRAINLHRAQRGLLPVVVWQRSFYETVIYHEKQLDQTRRYIIENPSRWSSEAAS